MAPSNDGFDAVKDFVWPRAKCSTNSTKKRRFWSFLAMLVSTNSNPISLYVRSQERYNQGHLILFRFERILP
jgi:hypothetical protein